MADNTQGIICLPDCTESEQRPANEAFKRCWLLPLTAQHRFSLHLCDSYSSHATSPTKHKRLPHWAEKAQWKVTDKQDCG